MEELEVSIEVIYHYRCKSKFCEKWWSIADHAPGKGTNTIVHCPHCGTIHRITAIVAHSELPKITRIEGAINE